jgi:hypothetical protein
MNLDFDFIIALLIVAAAGFAAGAAILRRTKQMLRRNSDCGFDCGCGNKGEKIVK